MFLRWNPLELTQGPVPVSSIVEEVPEIDSSFVEVRVQPQRTPDLTTRTHLVSKAVKGVSQRSSSIGVVRAPGRRLREDISALSVHR